MVPGLDSSGYASPTCTPTDTPADEIEEVLGELALGDAELAIRAIEEEALGQSIDDVFGSEEEVDFNDCFSTDSEGEGGGGYMPHKGRRAAAGAPPRMPRAN